MSPKKATPDKLNRDRAIRLSAIEGIRLSATMKFKFSTFDAQDLKPSARREAIRTYFKAKTLIQYRLWTP